MGADVLQRVGFRAHQAHRAAQKFLRHDEETLRELTGRRQDQAGFISATRQRIEELEQILQSDLEDAGEERDIGWDTESLRNDFGGRQQGVNRQSAPAAE
jgi:hypothetical protein